MQDVLQADWQDVWHSPQPPFFMDSFKSLVVSVLICFIPLPPCMRKSAETDALYLDRGRPEPQAPLSKLVYHSFLLRESIFCQKSAVKKGLIMKDDVTVRTGQSSTAAG